jgi:hypothetical protein
MNVRYRRMQLRDIRKCVEHIAAHPVLGPRYGKLIHQLPAAIRLALANELTLFIVLEEIQASATRFLGAVMCPFVSDDFLQESKTCPMFWVGPELVKRIAAGKSPLLSEVEVRDANSAEGLNLLVWHNTSHPQDIRRGDVVTTILTFAEQYLRGIRLRELVGQADCVEHYYCMRDAGGFYFDRVRGAYVSYPELNAQNFADEPRTCGLTRELASAQVTSWLASFFVSYAPPQLSLSRGEQQLLRAARDGETDEELGDRLGISIHAVKMRWRMIYDRAAACLPDLVAADCSRVDGEAFGRGKQKKQRLLDYVRKHPEELHPVSRKLLRQSATQRTAVT